LAISPATDDIANSVAIKKAKEVDPDGKRTIGKTYFFSFYFPLKRNNVTVSKSEDYRSCLQLVSF
jgi:hypothetical protein